MKTPKNAVTAKLAALVLGISLLCPIAAIGAGEELLATDVVADMMPSLPSTATADTAGASDDTGNASTSTTVAENAPAAGNLTEKDTVIETKPEHSNDSDIKSRIVGIFTEIEGLKGVVVSVNEGVVSLSGETPNEKKAQQAINLANRVSGVVAVEDRINRTLDVQDNVTPVVDGLQQQLRGLIKALPLLLVALLVFSLVTWLGSWLSRRTGLWRRITPNPFVADLLAQTVKVIFVIIGLILGLSLIGAEAIIGTLLGGAGVIGIAVGFAVKDTIENYIASLMLSMRQPFQARDYVDINDKSGIVVRLTSRATILMTMDGNQLRIPNSEVFKATILNYTKNPERRFTFQLGVDANDDPIAAIKVGLDAINALDFILADPKAMAIITEVGDSNIVLEFQVWVNQSDTDILKARSIAIRAAKHDLENQGFSLPEPIYKVRFNGDVEDAIKQLTVTGSSSDPVSIRTSKAGNSELISNTTIKANSTNATSTNAITNATTATNASSANQAASHRNQASITDGANKAAAKLRAKHILGNQKAEDVLDARPDQKLMQKVEEEIKDNSGDTDLLDGNSPQE